MRDKIIEAIQNAHIIEKYDTRTGSGWVRLDYMKAADAIMEVLEEPENKCELMCELHGIDWHKVKKPEPPEWEKRLDEGWQDIITLSQIKDFIREELKAIKDEVLEKNVAMDVNSWDIFNDIFKKRGI